MDYPRMFPSLPDLVQQHVRRKRNESTARFFLGFDGAVLMALGVLLLASNLGRYGFQIEGIGFESDLPPAFLKLCAGVLLLLAVAHLVPLFSDLNAPILMRDVFVLGGQNRIPFAGLDLGDYGLDLTFYQGPTLTPYCGHLRMSYFRHDQWPVRGGLSVYPEERGTWRLELQNEKGNRLLLCILSGDGTPHISLAETRKGLNDELWHLTSSDKEFGPVMRLLDSTGQLRATIGLSGLGLYREGRHTGEKILGSEDAGSLILRPESPPQPAEG